MNAAIGSSHGTPAGDGRMPARSLLLRLVRPYRGRLLFLVGLMLLQSGVVLVMPWLAGRFSAALLEAQPVGAVLAGLFALVLCEAALTYAVGVRLQGVATRLVADGCMRLFDHLQSLPLGWHHERRRGEVLSLLTDDMDRLGYFVTGTLVPLLPLLLTCGGSFLMMLRIAPGIGLGIAVLVPAVFLVLRIVGRRLRPLGRAVAEGHATRSALTEQNLAMLPVVKAFSGEPAESGRFRTHAHALHALQLRLVRIQSAIAPMVRVSAAAVVLVLLWLSSRGVAQGSIAPGELVSLLLYGLLLTRPVSELAGVYGEVQSARGAAERVLAAFAQASEPEGGERELRQPSGAIAFEGVEFAYPGRAPVLRGLDLVVAPGETIAITGPNGAGKSTLVHLLLRFDDPSAGRIRFDGVDLRELRTRSLRAHIGLVAQNVLLFNASVAENIAYGNPYASRGDIERAAHVARAHDFVALLPQGYDTVVGDQGIRLSGGQKQRIALARALLKDPPVLVLDEATAMFDPEGEREFIAECHDVLHSRTVILITHRPASLSLADRILRLQDGELVPVTQPA